MLIMKSLLKNFYKAADTLIFKASFDKNKRSKKMKAMGV